MRYTIMAYPNTETSGLQVDYRKKEALEDLETEKKLVYTDIYEALKIAKNCTLSNDYWYYNVEPLKED